MRSVWRKTRLFVPWMVSSSAASQLPCSKCRFQGSHLPLGISEVGLGSVFGISTFDVHTLVEEPWCVQQPCGQGFSPHLDFLHGPDSALSIVGLRTWASEML